MSVFKLDNPLKKYSWGSTDFIPRLLCREPEPGQPIAEMWMGAHETSSSMVLTKEGRVSLREYIQRTPELILGRVAKEYHAQLPFLLKVLSAAQPLSIQAHPSAIQAREGFLRESMRGIALDAPERSYRDANHKPELICALTPFTALCGFRHPRQITRDLDALGLLHFFPNLALSESEVLSTLFSKIIHARGEHKKLLLAGLSAVLKREGNGVAPEILKCCRTLHTYYPDDLGALAPLYLNLFHLQPGEALYLDSGVLHCYIEGSGVEVMANSDNVLRGGLTSKHIDTDELLRIVDFSPYQAGIVLPVQISAGVQEYPVPARDFALRILDVSPNQTVELDCAGMPVILLCEWGNLELVSVAETILLDKGTSLFIGADTQSMNITGSGRVWLATVAKP